MALGGDSRTGAVAPWPMSPLGTCAERTAVAHESRLWGGRLPQIGCGPVLSRGEGLGLTGVWAGVGLDEEPQRGSQVDRARVVAPA